ncbi:DUF262 domain-containing protein [Romboutsia sp. 1001216sp1]|uniref:DUF262 domain-containing protein n=1 Tax=unclassified Romboutsia TaxID=2626894 RepID=UPI0018A8F872|nr:MULTISPECIES: DUF262 domain-containing protein [unclassified Romboutsia]MDB8792604.1 DUF262 domain-containing protein [Romboutsia sp. 1001216sp1]MDB8796229.1 DUF262 domain-containing protein [Romboutsia sp. 1001216sp1]MDB8798222.1 DUF262 domain-containing protein [Romboutsia sp. 1001216sp1]
MNNLEKEINIQNKIDEDIEETTEQSDCSIMTNMNITQVRSEMGFKTLVEGFDSMNFVIPKYQRKFVWKKEQVQELAISLLRGLPIPPIYAYRNDYNQLEILDGQQRMLSLFLYYKGKYFKNLEKNNVDLSCIMTDPILSNDDISFEDLLIGKNLLRDVKYQFEYIENEKYIEDGIEKIKSTKKIENINYDKLDKVVKRKLDFTPITIIEINVGQNMYKNRILYTVFKNLNTGGTKLKNQEVRNGAYQSAFYDMIHKINNFNKKWRSLYGDKHKHSKDVELLLRFASIERYFKLNDNKQFIINNYNGSYTSLLNDFSDEAITFNEYEINKYELNIKSFIDRFEGKTKIPHLLLESLYLASIYTLGNYKISDDFCISIIEDEQYQSYIKSPSSAKIKVKERFEYVYNKLQEYVKSGNR